MRKRKYDEYNRTLTISNKTLYTELKKSMKMGNNSGALVASNDETQELTVDMDKVTIIYMMLNGKTNDDFKNNFTALLEGCSNLKSIQLRNADLSGIDLRTGKRLPVCIWSNVNWKRRLIWPVPI